MSRFTVLKSYYLFFSGDVINILCLLLYCILSQWENHHHEFLPTSSDISHTVPSKWDACVCLVCRLCSPWCINWLNAFTKITFVAALVIAAAIFCCFSMFNPPLTHSLVLHGMYVMWMSSDRPYGWMYIDRWTDRQTDEWADRQGIEDIYLVSLFQCLQ